LIRLLTNIQNLSGWSKTFAIVVAFLAPLLSIIHVVLVLLLVDALTSIYYQMKQKPGGFVTKIKVIESSKLKKTLEKMFFYVLILIVFYSFDLYILKITPITSESINTFSITNLAAVLVCLVELTSIASNVSKITDNPIFNKIVAIFQKKANKQFDIEETKNTEQ